ncbi:MAG TPA: TPM domain-containing protein [Candidatus Limnocylindria bacterium]
MSVRRRLAAAPVLAAGFLLALAGAAWAGAPFPDPETDRAVYDEAGVVDATTEAALEARIDAIEARSGAEIAIFLQVDPSKDFDTNLTAAEALLNQWGVGRQGYDDGFVILVSYEDDLEHGVISTYAGSGFKVAYLSVDEQDELINGVMAPYFRSGDPGGGLLAALDTVDEAVTAEATAALDGYRQLNAVVGIPGAAVVLLVTVGTAVYQWRRHGDDPDLVDSPSVLMAGPPADMTPPLATVLREGRATGNAIRTILVQLAGTGLIRFRNLDRVSQVKRDDDPDPETDPAIDLLDPPTDQAPPEGPLGDAYRELVVRGGSFRSLSREALWGVNDALDPLKKTLEQEAVRLGWLTRLPTPVITRWVGAGVLEILVAAAALFFGLTIPMSGLTVVGVALLAGGLVTIGLGTQMSKRTANGAYVDAMLKAYRRTLEKTLAQARSMAEVVTEPTVAVLADTPDKAVVWGVALGLHAEVGAVLAREMADPQMREAARASGAWYPMWLGTSGGGDGGVGGAGGSLFSGSGVPDFGGMVSALGDVGSTPASSSSSGGGGFGGGGGGGGGGSSGGF